MYILGIGSYASYIMIHSALWDFLFEHTALSCGVIGIIAYAGTRVIENALHSMFGYRHHYYRRRYYRY